MKYALLLVFSFFAFSVKAQNHDRQWADSLIHSLANQTNDTIKVKVYNQVGLFYTDINLDSASKYAQLGLNLTRKMKWEKGISVFHTLFGNIYNVKGELDAALQQHEIALSYSVKIKDSVNMATAYSNMGVIANAKGNYVEASKYYILAKNIAEASKNYYLIGVVSDNLALVYQYQQDDVKSLQYAKAALQAFQHTEDPIHKVNPFKCIGDYFKKMGKKDSALYYYQQALQIAEENNNLLKEATVLNVIAEYYADQKDLKNALSTALKAKDIFNEVEPNSEDAIENKGIIGKYYLEMAKVNPSSKNLLALAKSYLLETVSKGKELELSLSLARYQYYLTQVYELEGDYKNAYAHFKSYHQLNDSIFSQENKNKIAAIENKRAIEQKNMEIERHQLQFAEQRKNIYLLLFGLGVVAIIGLLFYRLSAIRKQKNSILTELNLQLEKANHTKAKFFAILSHDLRSPIANLINFLNLQKMDNQLLSIEQKAEQEEKIEQSAHSLLEVMEGMLLWSKGQMENFKPEKSEFLVNNLFQHLQNLFAGINTIQFEYKAEEQLKVFSDENYLKTILQNLTQNALNVLKDQPDAKIIWKAWQKRNDVYLSILDNGPGLSEEQILKFKNNHSVSSTKTGLGLYIVKDMAKAIDCNLLIESKAGKGTAFILVMKNKFS